MYIRTCTRTCTYTYVCREQFNIVWHTLPTVTFSGISFLCSMSGATTAKPAPLRVSTDTSSDLCACSGQTGSTDIQPIHKRSFSHACVSACVHLCVCASVRT